MMIKSFRKIVRELQKMTAFPNIQKCTTKPWKTNRKSSYKKVQSDTEKHGNTKYTKIVGKIEKKCRKGLEL